MGKTYRMNTRQLIEEAKQKLDQVIALLKKAQENPSIEEMYDLNHMVFELETISNNPRCIQATESIEDILDAYGDEWNDVDHED